MFKKLAVALGMALALISAPKVHAQTPLPTPIVCHGCPDRVTYNFLEELPFVSEQHHWSARGSNIQGDFIDTLGFNPNGTVLDPSHHHVECGKPSHLPTNGATPWAMYGEYSGPMHFDCQIVLRDFAGEFALYGTVHFHSSTGQWWYNVLWDDTGTSTPPRMIGRKDAPMGVQVFKFHFDIDPRQNFHGFDVVDILGHAVFSNGDFLDSDNLFSYFNNVDPNAPITQMPQGPADKPVMATQGAPFVNPIFNPGDSFGVNEVFVENYLPTAPLSGAWRVPTTSNEAASQDPTTEDALGHGTLFQYGPVASTNSYGQTTPSTNGSCQTRRDQNFHMEDLSNIGPDGLPVMKGIPGTITSEVDRSQTIMCQIVIDNTGLPVGDHTYAISRSQPENQIKTNAVSTLLVIHVPVPDGTVVINPPPPPVCVPPAVLVGSTCTVPPPPPPPVCVPPAMLMGGQCVSMPPPPPPPPTDEWVNVGSAGLLQVQQEFFAGMATDNFRLNVAGHIILFP